MTFTYCYRKTTAQRGWSHINNCTPQHTVQIEAGTLGNPTLAKYGSNSVRVFKMMSKSAADIDGSLGETTELTSMEGASNASIQPLNISTPNISTPTKSTPSASIQPIEIDTPNVPTPAESTPSVSIEPINIDTPNIATPSETPEPITVDTPSSDDSQGTAQKVIEPPEDELSTTQEVITHIAENSVSVIKSLEASTPPKSTRKSRSLSKADVDATEAENIIAELIVGAPCDVVRDILRSYSTTNSYSKQLTIFNSNRCKKNDLIQTLLYLGEQTQQNELKNDCARKLIYRIQALLNSEYESR